MTEDEGDGLSMTEICEPVPGEHALGTDHDVFSVWVDGMEEGIGVGRHVAVEGDLAMVVEDTDIHGSSMEIDTAVEEVLFGVESYWGLLFSMRWCYPSIRSDDLLRGGLNEYPAAPPDRCGAVAGERPRLPRTLRSVGPTAS
jgi:hypothetical protein